MRQGMIGRRVINGLITIGILVGIGAVVVLSPVSEVGMSGEEATFCLGFILIFAYFLARILKEFHLPMISSYIFAGAICGPFVINLLSHEVVEKLQLFDNVALAIIALIAGGEMKVRVLKARMGSFVGVIFGQVSFSFLLTFVVIVFAKEHIAFLEGADMGFVAAVALLFGLVIAARSPSTTIGVVAEARAKGPLTELLIGVTVLLDVLILLLLAFVVPLSRMLSDPAVTFSLSFTKDLLVKVLGSIGIGVVFGFIVGAYIRWVKEYLSLFLIGVSFFGSMVCHNYHFEPLLAFMVAGFFIENYSPMGEQLIGALERSAFPVYVIFFSISGAAIDFNALRATWGLALILVVVRMFSYYAGTVVPGAIVPTLRPYARSSWMGFLPQAGVALAIATIIERTFSWGNEIKTVVLAMVALNQLIGPIALKYLLVKKGEAGKMDME